MSLSALSLWEKRAKKTEVFLLETTYFQELLQACRPLIFNLYKTFYCLYLTYKIPAVQLPIELFIKINIIISNYLLG